MNDALTIFGVAMFLVGCLIVTASAYVYLIQAAHTWAMKHKRHLGNSCVVGISIIAALPLGGILILFSYIK